MVDEKLIERSMKYWLETPDANCAQTTACSLLEHYGYVEESKQLYKVYCVYGGGLSWRLACGTITGNVGALSYIAAENGLNKEETEKIVKQFLSKMEEKYGDLNCKNLMQKWYVNGDIDFDLPGRHEKCTDLVKTSLEISNQLIKKIIFK
jgi:C_GCAxxG_C_C family probable redox protein